MEFRVLGPLEVVAGDAKLSLGGPRQRLVLAYLVLEANRVVPTERLIDRIWGDEPPDAARSALFAYVSRLRKLLGPSRIQARPPGYVLLAEPEEVDSLRFAELVAKARRETEPTMSAARLDEALELWRGDPLSDLAEHDALRPAITRLREQQLAVLEDKAEAQLAIGQHRQAVPLLEGLLGEHPLRERLWGLLMLALYRAGRQGEALAAFHRARGYLSSELGIDPSADLRRLHERILGQDAALDLPTPAASEPLTVAADVGSAPPPIGTGGRPARAAAAAPIRVVLADDHFIVREGISRLLTTQPDMQIVALCSDLDGLLAAVEAERPDVVVTDIRMPPGNSDEGIRAAARLRAGHPEVGVVVLSQYSEPGYALALLDGGSARRAYLLKERVEDVDQLAGAIRAVARGGSVIDPKVVDSLMTDQARMEKSRFDELTPRERDVLREMAAGKSNAAIAQALVLTERSVETVIHAIFLKLGIAWEKEIHRRVKAVILYLSRGA